MFICFFLIQNQLKHNKKSAKRKDTTKSFRRRQWRSVKWKVKKKERRALVFLTYPFILLHSSLQHTRNYNWSWIFIPPHNPSISRYLLCVLCSFVLFWLIYNGIKWSMKWAKVNKWTTHHSTLDSHISGYCVLSCWLISRFQSFPFERKKKRTQYERLTFTFPFFLCSIIMEIKWSMNWTKWKEKK